MKHTIELQPFSVPNFVRQVVKPGLRQDGFVETPAIRLADLDADTLDAMCSEFREAVFAKAGKAPQASIADCNFTCARASTCHEYECEFESHFVPRETKGG